MKLFTFSKSPSPQRLQLFLDYKGIRLETQEVDLRKLEQFTAEYRAFNPRGIVPALQLDDGSALCDVIAIATYLEELHPERPLLGTDPLQKARILSWDQYILEAGFLAIQEILRNSNPAFVDRALPGPLPLPQIPALAERGRQRLPLFWQALETQLTRSDFLVDDALSMADIDALAVVDFAGRVRATPGDDYPALQQWHRRVREALARSE